ncbi:MAG: ATP-binding protein [Chthoniobacteraceae bacterium]
MTTAHFLTVDDADPIQERLLFACLLENIPDRIYFKDEKSRFISVSHAMAVFFGEDDPAKIIGKTDFDFFTKEHAQPAFDDEQQVMRTGEPIIGKVEKETLPDGRVGWVLTSKMPLRDADGRIIGTCGISKDITSMVALEKALEESNTELSRRRIDLERALKELTGTHQNLKNTQEQLIEAEKCQSIGLLSAGLAHEIKNPLNILNMGVAYLSSLPPVLAENAVGDILQNMKDAINRVDAVISTLMDNDPGHLKLEKTTLDALLNESLAIIHDELTSAGIKVVLDMVALPEFRMDRNKFERMLIGIFLNAVEAMDQGGTLAVSTSIKELTGTETNRNPGGRSGWRFRAGEKMAVIEIHDTGHGIPKDALSKIFDPFFTTKETGKGMGLGLTLGRKIVELHHGMIEIVNLPGNGTKVTILLPFPPE